MSLSNSKFKNIVLGNEYLPISTIIFQMNNYRLNKNYDKLCFVEGKTDEQFYSHANIKNINFNKTKFIYNKSNDKESTVGKNAVLRTAQYINEKLKHELYKYIFIVDHDFDGLNSEEVQLSDCEKSLITVLPCYSFENYFLYKNNVEKIFKYLFNDENALSEFNILYFQFVNEIIEYYSLKSVFTACIKRKTMKHLKLNYKKTYSDEDIFKFDFNRIPHFNANYLNYEINKMKLEVEKHEETMKYFKKQNVNLTKNNNQIKGKILFLFLSDYIFQKHNIKIDNKNEEKYISIVKKLDIDLKIKNLKGAN